MIPRQHDQKVFAPLEFSVKGLGPAPQLSNIEAQTCSRTCASSLDVLRRILIRLYPFQLLHELMMKAVPSDTVELL
jgi:hypothetical protein